MCPGSNITYIHAVGACVMLKYEYTIVEVKTHSSKRSVYKEEKKEQAHEQQTEGGRNIKNSNEWFPLIFSSFNRRIYNNLKFVEN